jgi:hypothetical protein
MNPPANLAVPDAIGLGNSIRKIEQSLRQLGTAKADVQVWLKQLDSQSADLISASKEASVAALYAFASRTSDEPEFRLAEGKRALQFIASRAGARVSFLEIKAALRETIRDLLPILSGLVGAALIESNGTNYAITAAGRDALQSLSA